MPVVLGVTPYRKGNELESLPPEAVSFLDEMAAAGATVFDVSAALTKASANVEDLYLDMAHFNADGHRAVGEALGATLDKVIPEPAPARRRVTPPLRIQSALTSAGLTDSISSSDIS